MSDHWSDEERMAAFLDGRLDPESREEMLAHLLRNDEDREVAAGAASILRQMDAEEAEEAEQQPIAGVVSIEDARRSRSPGGAARTFRWVAFAAVLAALALVTGRMLLSRPSPYDPVRLAERLQPDSVPEKWSPAGSSARGDSPRATGLSPLQRASRAARAGALLTDLAVAVEAQESEKTRLLAGQIAERFDVREGRPNGALGRIKARPDSPSDELMPLVEKATDRIARGGAREALQVGAWAETARLAAARRDAAFFADTVATREMLDRAARIFAPNPDAVAAIQRARPVLLPVGSPPPWAAVTHVIEEMATEITSD